MLALLAASLVPSFAADITVRVGNNWYRGPGTTGDVDIRDIFVGDRIIFVWVAGFHPTQSDSSPQAWPTFTPSASLPSVTIPFNTAGVFPYHCQAHGSPGNGQYGIITVIARTPTATLNAKEAGISVNVFPNPSRGQVTVKLDQFAFTLVLRACYRAGDLARADAVLRRMETSDTPPNVGTYSVILLHYASLSAAPPPVRTMMHSTAE